MRTNLEPCGYANSIPPALPLHPQGVLPSPLKLGAGPSLAARLAGHVINLNVPKAEAVVDIQGYQLAWQGQHCHFPDWQASDLAAAYYSNLPWCGIALFGWRAIGLLRSRHVLRSCALPAAQLPCCSSAHCSSPYGVCHMP